MNRVCVKRCGCVAAAVFATWAGSASHAAPIVEYKFDETGKTAPSTGSDATAMSTFPYNGSGNPAGDMHGAPGSGVSGQPGDRALDNGPTVGGSTGMGSAGHGGYGTIGATATTNLTGLQSFTVTGWFKTASGGPITNAARIIDYTSSGAGFLLLGSNNGNLQLNVNASNVITNNASYADAGSWVFFAVTYDGTSGTNNVNFYKGTTSASEALAQTFSMAAGKELAPTGGTVAYVGNAANTIRVFDGQLDDLRVFGSTTDGSGALTPAAVEQVRVGDVAVAPEPASLGLLAAGALGLSRRRRRQGQPVAH